MISFDPTKIVVLTRSKKIGKTTYAGGTPLVDDLSEHAEDLWRSGHAQYAEEAQADADHDRIKAWGEEMFARANREDDYQAPLTTP